MNSRIADSRIADRRIAVLGGGIIGLTSASILVDRGYSVVVAASHFSPNTTSDVAAAVWYPYAVAPRDLALEWSRVTFDRFRRESESLPDIVRMVEFHELFVEPESRPWWRSAVDEFRTLTIDELPAGYAAGFAAPVPIVNSTDYLGFLRSDLENRGVRFLQLERDLDSFDELDERVVVNCTGLGSRTLCDDTELFPIRGQVIVVGKTDLQRTFADDQHELAPTYIVPRANDCVLGGTATVGDADLAERDAETESILERCSAISPELARPEIQQVKVGLRPGRKAVRVEIEHIGRQAIVHNYGHGGAGFTLAWGVAEHAADLVDCIEA